MTRSKHVAHCGSQSGITYYDLTLNYFKFDIIQCHKHGILILFVNIDAGGQISVCYYYIIYNGKWNISVDVCGTTILYRLTNLSCSYIHVEHYLIYVVFNYVYSLLPQIKE